MINNNLKIEILKIIDEVGGQISFTVFLNEVKKRGLTAQNKKYQEILKEYEGEGKIEVISGNSDDYDRSSIFKLTNDGYNTLNTKIFDININSKNEEITAKSEEVLSNNHLDSHEKSWRLDYLANCLFGKQQKELINEQNRHNKKVFITQIISLIVIIFTFLGTNIFSMIGVSQSKDMINIMKDEFSVTNRPLLVVERLNYIVDEENKLFKIESIIKNKGKIDASFEKFRLEIPQLDFLSEKDKELIISPEESFNQGMITFEYEGDFNKINNKFDMNIRLDYLNPINNEKNCMEYKYRFAGLNDGRVDILSSKYCD